MGAFVFNFLTVLGYASSIVGYAGMTWIWGRIATSGTGSMNTFILDYWMMGAVFAGFWICWLTPSWKQRLFPARREAELFRCLDERDSKPRLVERFETAVYHLMRISGLVFLVTIVGIAAVFAIAAFTSHAWLSMASHFLSMVLGIAASYAIMSRATLRLTEWVPRSKHQSFRMSD